MKVVHDRRENTMRHVAAGIVGGALALLLAGPALATPPPDHKVTVCHRTGSASNPYVEITVDIASSGYVKGGHDHHEQVGNGLGGDVIPAYDYTPKHGSVFHYPGKNLGLAFPDGTTGAELLAAGCVLVTPTPTTPPPTSSPPTTTPPTTPPTEPTSPPVTTSTIPPTSGTRPPFTSVQGASPSGPPDTALTGSSAALFGGLALALLLIGGAALRIASRKDVAP